MTQNRIITKVVNGLAAYCNYCGLCGNFHFFWSQKLYKMRAQAGLVCFLAVKSDKELKDAFSFI